MYFNYYIIDIIVAQLNAPGTTWSENLNLNIFLLLSCAVVNQTNTCVNTKSFFNVNLLENK